MSTLTSLACIGGGQMAEALIRGIVAAKLLAPEHIHVIEPNPERLHSLQQNHGIQATADPAELCAHCRVLLAAVKPQVARQVLSAYAPHLGEGHLLISIMAGISLADLSKYAGAKARLIRAMPNTPALVLAGATAFSPGASATRDDCDLARAIFDAVGASLELPEEQIDAVTGLSGSGPGYVFTFLEALIDGGVLAGLPRPHAEKLALHTLYGSAKLALKSGEHAAVLKGRVTSPGGTTIAGIQALEQGAFRGLVMEAVRKAGRRSAELGG
ncbi:MAG: pyrroline-5-carboxylate reductase [bacterium]|nr:pyrroline-5-carboxylate reductase [bacterium]